MMFEKTITSKRQTLLIFLLGVIGGTFLASTFRTLEFPLSRLHLNLEEKTNLDPHQERKLWSSNPVSKLEKEIRNLKNSINRLGKDVTKWKDRANNYAKKVSNLKNIIEEGKNVIKVLESAKNELNNQVSNLKGEVNDLTDAITSIPKTLKAKIVDPIVSEAKKIENDVKKIKDITNTVADSTVDVIKKLDFLPKSGADLAKYLGNALLNFMSQDFCVPYDCIANKLGVDISDIELYSSEKVTISTALTPKTCLQVIDVEFDHQKLTNFLNLFRDLKALKDIFDKVQKYLRKEMRKIVDVTDEIEEFIEDIENTANDAAKTLGLGRSRQLLVTTQEGEQVTMEHLSAIAYEKGLAHFHKLYGDHVNDVFRERNLAANGRNYIGFKSLKMKLTQDFGQTLTLEAEARSAYSGSLFDESMHRNSVFAVPMTAGLVKLVASGSIETSMPYSMIMEAAAGAEFKYNVGDTSITLDIISGKATESKRPFTTNLDVDASAGLSGTMSLNFAASTSLGICLGPTQDACVTITLDASQTSAAGFDVLAGLDLEKNALTPLYTDVLEYDTQENCDGQLALHAGYWQYIEAPAVTVAVTGTGFCTNKSNTLYELEGKILQSSTDNFCTAV